MTAASMAASCESVPATSSSTSSMVTPSRRPFFLPFPRPPLDSVLVDAALSFSSGSSSSIANSSNCFNSSSSSSCLRTFATICLCLELCSWLLSCCAFLYHLLHAAQWKLVTFSSAATSSGAAESQPSMTTSTWPHGRGSWVLTHFANRRTLSLNILRAFSLTSIFFCRIKRRIRGLGASSKSHLSCFANARSDRHVEKFSQYA
mmetsp:Transcript_39764/g.105053  ORF Transcript_39764/g.105053 Transcript_39764/m.105053 type:complete len:204 (+) Transcript_39764:501-1112(+)